MGSPSAGTAERRNSGDRHGGPRARTRHLAPRAARRRGRGDTGGDTPGAAGAAHATEAARPFEAAGVAPGPVGAPRAAAPPVAVQAVSGRPTSRDVARLAGVSQATVSLVLGDKWRGRVSPRTADAVRQAARELGYRPNLAARHLRLSRTRTALLVVPALSNEFFAHVYAGAAEVAAAHGVGVVLYPRPRASARPGTRSARRRPPSTG